MSPADWELEAALWSQGYLIAGLDEAGRGPLAGPVVAAAVIFPEGCEISGLDDSKKLSPKRREELFEQIQDCALATAWAASSNELIDQRGIIPATYGAMLQAIDQLNQQPNYVLVDGPRLPRQLSLPAQAVVRGDQKSCSIAAASIIAKVVRDRIMLEMHEQYPDYGFARHKGYGTKVHLQALVKHGPCPCHRRSFAPLRETRLQFE